MEDERFLFLAGEQFHGAGHIYYYTRAGDFVKNYLAHVCWRPFFGGLTRIFPEKTGEPGRTLFYSISGERG